MVSTGTGPSVRVSSLTCLEPQVGGLEWPGDDWSNLTRVTCLRLQFSLVLASSVLCPEISGSLHLHVASPCSDSSKIDRLPTWRLKVPKRGKMETTRVSEGLGSDLAHSHVHCTLLVRSGDRASTHSRRGDYTRL